MIQHDPFKHIINNIGLVESCNPLHNALLTHCSTKVKELKDLYYNNQHEFVNYNAADYQTAYMLYYFPIYIENIYHVLARTNIEEFSDLFQNGIKVCFYGGGPAPELYGFLSYLKEKFSDVKKFDAHFFDKNNWEVWRLFCFDNYISDYWGEEKSLNYYSHICDLCEFQKPEGISSHPIIKEADLHIIQNCGLDIINSVKDIDNYRNVFYNLTSAMKVGSVIVIIDVPVYNVPINGGLFDIRGNMYRIRDQARSQNSCKIIRNVSDGGPYEYVPNIINYPIIHDHFPYKDKVKYHALVMKKTNENAFPSGV